MAIYPFIFLRDKSLKANPQFVRHERIHLRQQIELLWLPFFMWYGLEFLVRLYTYRNFDKAYRNISFEREAYAKQNDEVYLENRPTWNFIKFL